MHCMSIVPGSTLESIKNSFHNGQSQIVWVEEHDKRSFLLDLMDASGLGAKDLDGEASRFDFNLTIISNIRLHACFLEHWSSLKQRKEPIVWTSSFTG